MGYKEIELKLPTDYTEEQLKKSIKKEIMLVSFRAVKGVSSFQNEKKPGKNIKEEPVNAGIEEFSYQIIRKSLDARKKNKICWQMKVGVKSGKIKSPLREIYPSIKIPYKKRNKKIVVIGCGPAGFFSAFLLQKAGFDTAIIERGADVGKRAEGISNFEKTGILNPVCNYAFGEGGAGTFSDGKLTSRTKGISLERNFILSSYVDAGADEEIKYLAHPHIGSDNLTKIVKNLREKYQNIGGNVYFETSLDSLVINKGTVSEARTNKGVFSADEFIIASGNSAYDTYRMLMRSGIKFQTKNFAIGCRVEHPQKMINAAQWGCESLPGLKAAEYRLTSKGNSFLPIYTFCMCPGGAIVNAAAYSDINIVNGMSLYNRDGKFANAACVAGVNLNNLTCSVMTPMQALDWVEALEKKFYTFANGYKAPYCSILDFINKKIPGKTVESSYSHGLVSAPLWELLPSEISASIRIGLKDFSKKIPGFDTGSIMGLETKTSSPVQVLRENGLCTGFENLYIVGEGSGYSGGIISSAVDGIKTAIRIIDQKVKMISGINIVKIPDISFVYFFQYCKFICLNS